MEARLDAILRRIGTGMAHYADEVEIRGYISRLETRALDAEAKWRTEWTRAQTAESRLDALRATVTGPGKKAFVVFLPDEGESDHEPK